MHVYSLIQEACFQVFLRLERVLETILSIHPDRRSSFFSGKVIATAYNLINGYMA